MKNNLSLLFCILLCLKLAAQNVEFKTHKLNYKLSYEMLKMKGEPDIGMAGIGTDLFIFEKLPNLYLTLNSYSAITGERPGLISFGAGLGYVQPLFDSPLAVDAGIFIGGGGGANAPDGGGLITREHLNLSYSFKNFSVFGGYSRLDFPTGNMGSNNINFGVSLSSFFDTAQQLTGNLDVYELNSEIKKSRFRFNLLGTRYLHFSEGPTFSAKKDKNIQLVGVEIDRFINDKFYAALKLNGAVTGGVDGYMSYLIGFGFEQSLWTGSLALDTQVLGGPSGGGGIASGGGGTLQGSLGLRAHLGNEYELKAALGQTIAPEGNFNGTFFELGLSKNFNFISPQKNQNTPYSLKLNEKLHGFGLEILNRTYFPPTGLDKNGDEYDKLFNLIGFQISKRLNKNFAALGSTYWAYQGSYGAYAEGWLGLRYIYPFNANWVVQAQFLGGAAGGGGIDLGSGLAFQYGAGLARAIDENWKISLNGGKIHGLHGNFKPYFIDLGVNYSFFQVTKNKMIDDEF